MKKQNFQKKLAFKTTKISHVSYLNTVRGGAAARFTENPCIISDVDTCQTVTEPIKLTEAIRCTHTIGNGQNPDGTPCKF
ncbi:hypothetical protein U8527_20940 [Kordia algicida OT-1]|uniref:Uncharacterized protein n=1 Tax=Kordia algicida OT-1 TaxID=391587 RepID=A9DL41_9FLAO|nr:hypothetical protein [Kordia algicida]EDP98473.1 hypothetical protein KAOT1_14687 [Kordia algicida OT-1]